ncbi:MAG: MarC family protein [Parahaliea sp.]
MDSVQLIKMFGAFFAIMNPFINLPIFLALTDGFSVSEQRALALRITVYSVIMCVVILVAGQGIIGFFGITIDQFRVAGGAVLASIAWSMLNGQADSSHHGSGQEQNQMKKLSNLAFYPITFPMIVGPGTISTLIIYAGHARSLRDLAELGAVVGVILLILFVVLSFAGQIGKVLSQTMRVITTRIMGMILLAIAVQMIINGLSVLLPGLTH